MEQNAVDNLIVVKRSGQRVPFNGAKVAIAIKKGFDSVYEEYDEKQVNKVLRKAVIYCKIRFIKGYYRIDYRTMQRENELQVAKKVG